jgi:hypothetical protein
MLRLASTHPRATAQQPAKAKAEAEAEDKIFEFNTCYISDHDLLMIIRKAVYQF